MIGKILTIFIEESFVMKWYRLTNPPKRPSIGVQILLDHERSLETNRFNRAMNRVQSFLDDATGVSDYQKRQRMGMIVHKVEAPIPYVRGWNDRFEEQVIDGLVQTLNMDVTPYLKKIFT